MIFDSGSPVFAQYPSWPVRPAIPIPTQLPKGANVVLTYSDHKPPALLLLSTNATIYLIVGPQRLLIARAPLVEEGLCLGGLS